MINRKAKGARTDKLRCVESNCFELCVLGCEYFASDQRGGIHGTIYRQYFTTALPSNLTTGMNVSRLIDFAMVVTEGTNRYLFHGYGNRAEAWVTIYLKGTTGKEDLRLHPGITLQDGWVEYTK